MTIRLSACARLGAVVSLLELVACSGSSGGDPGPDDLAQATQALDQQLNKSAEAMRNSLVSANADKRIFPWELVITDGSGSVPVDWWLYDHGFIKVGGVAGVQGYFVPTAKGEALLKGGAPRWLVSSFKGKPDVVCAGSQMFQTCKVTATATVAAAADAKDLVSDPAQIPDQSFQVALQKGADGWGFSDFAPSSSPAPADVGRRALFGDDRTIAKARYRYALEVNRQVH